mgnify:FL=1
MGKTRAGCFALRGQRMALLHLETMTQAVDSADSVDPRALEALNRYFGYDSFRPGQSGIVSAILTGRDVLGVMPTGAGKSICYQIPAAILPGVAIVISPLISLMRDQVDALNDVGLPAAFINTTQTPDEQDLVFAQALSGQIKLLYVAPERLETERFRNFAVRVPISLVAVDEAHCVSQWGQDFRSSYLGIGEFIAGLPTRPTVAAFTATATERVRRDIVSILGLHTPSITVTGFDRPNLYFDVISMPRKDKASWVASYIASHPDESGIVYCATRKETEALAESLNSAVAELRAAGGGGCVGYRHHRRRLPWRYERRRTREGATRFRHRPCARGRGHQCVRHGHRQIQRAVRHPPQHARIHRSVLPGGGSRRTRRRTKPLHAVVERIGHRHPPPAARFGLRKRTIDSRRAGGRTRVETPAARRDGRLLPYHGLPARVHDPVFRRNRGRGGENGRANAWAVAPTASTHSKPSTSPTSPEPSAVACTM